MAKREPFACPSSAGPTHIAEERLQTPWPKACRQSSSHADAACRAPTREMTVRCRVQEKSHRELIAELAFFSPDFWPARLDSQGVWV